MAGILKGFFVVLKAACGHPPPLHLPSPHKEERIISGNLERGWALRESLPAEEAALALASGRRDRGSTSKGRELVPKGHRGAEGPLHRGR